MAQNREVGLTIAAKTTGVAGLRRLADEINTLRTSGEGAGEQFKGLSSTLRSLSNQQALLTSLASLRSRTDDASRAFTEASRTANESARALRDRQRAVQEATSAEQAAATRVRALSESVSASKASLDGARAALRAYREEIAGAGRRTEEQRARMQALDQAVRENRASWRAQRDELTAATRAHTEAARGVTAANRALSESEAGFRRNKAAAAEAKQAFTTLRGEAHSTAQALRQAGGTTTDLSVAQRRLTVETGQLEKQLQAARAAAANAGMSLDAAFSSLRIRSVAQIKAEIDRVNAALARITSESGRAGMESARAFAAAKQRLVELNREMQNAGTSTGGFGSQLGALLLRFGPAVAGAASLTAVFTRFAPAVFEAALAAERAARSLTMIVGSAQEAQKHLEFVRRTSNSLGLAVRSTSEAYARFTAAAKGSALEGEGAREVFEATAEAVAVLGLSTARTENVFLALQQMMSKGVVNMEEWRQQLGESLPIATEALALGMQKSRSEVLKLIETGRLASDEALPAFAKGLRMIGAEGGEQTKTMTQAINQFSNAIELMGRKLQDSRMWDVMIAGVENVAVKTSAGTVALDGLAEQAGIVYDAFTEWDFDTLFADLRFVGLRTKVELAQVVQEVKGTEAAVALFGQETVDAIGKIEFAGVSATVALKTAQEQATKSIEGALKALEPVLTEVGNRLKDTETRIGESQGKVKTYTEAMAAGYRALTSAVQGELTAQTAAVELRYEHEREALENSQASERLKIAEGTRLLTEATAEQIRLISAATQTQLDLLEDERLARVQAAQNSITNEEDLQREILQIDQDIDSAKRTTLENAKANYRQYIDALISEEQRHLAAVRQLEEEKRLLKMSTEDRIREIRRQGMADEQATADRLTQINELEAKAREAISLGEFDQARQYGKQAMDLAAQVASAQTSEAKRAASEFGNAERLKTQIADKEAQARIANERAMRATAGAEQQRYAQQAAALMQEAEKLKTELANQTTQATDREREARETANTAIERMTQLEGVLSGAIESEITARESAAAGARSYRQDAENAYDAVGRKIDDVAGKLQQDYQLSIKVESAAVDGEIERLKALFAEQELLTTIKADLTAAEAQLQEYREKVIAGETLPADADFTQAEAALQAFSDYARNEGAPELSVKTNEALTAIESVQRRIVALGEIETRSRHEVGSNVDSVRGEIDSLNGRNTSSTHTIYVRRVEENATGGLAGFGGRPVRAFARGGRVGPLMRRGRVPGSGNKDSVYRTLEAGAYVIRKAAVAAHGGNEAVRATVARALRGAPSRARAVAPTGKVDAVLMPGEEVIPRNVVSRIGPAFFDRLNSVVSPALNFTAPVLNGVQAFASGGPAGDSKPRVWKQALGAQELLERAEKIGGLTLRKMIEKRWREQGKRISKTSLGFAQYMQMLRETSEELDRIQIAQEQAEKGGADKAMAAQEQEQAETGGTGKAMAAPAVRAAGGDSGVALGVRAAAGGSATAGARAAMTVNIQFNGSSRGAVRVASQADASNLRGILEQLGAEMGRAV